MKRRTVLAGLGATAAVGVLARPSILRAQTPITLNGAVQFNDGAGGTSSDATSTVVSTSINDAPISESQRKFHWPLGRRPDDHPSLSDLDL